VQSIVPITDDIYWVGVNDRQTDLFESIWPLPRGVSYNSYLIVDEKVALMDTVKKIALPAYLAKLKQALGDRGKIDYLIVNHLEPDHSGSLPVLREIYPQMEIIGTKKMAEFLANLYGITEGVRIVQDSQELDLGKRKLKFVSTPMVHWPETMMTYESTEKILFSGDAFGGFGTLDGSIFEDKVDIKYFEDEILRYFSNIVGKYTSTVQKAIAKLQGTPIQIIAPTHGPVWRKHPERIVQLYDRWSRQETEPGVVIAYATMYENTEKMMEAVVSGLQDENLSTIRIHNVSRSHASFIIRDVWRYRGLLLGSPTYDTKLFPLMDSLIRLLETKMIKNRITGVFGSFGWSGGAVKTLQEFTQNSHIELVEPVVEARFAPGADDLDKCRQLGRNMARHIRESSGA